MDKGDQYADLDGSSSPGSERPLLPALEHSDHDLDSRGRRSPPPGWRSPSRFRPRWWFRLSVLLNVVAAVYVAHTFFSARSEDVADVAIEASEKPVGVVNAAFTPGIEGGQCSLCAVNPALCEELGPKNAIRALGYRGENARLRRMLAKLRSGQPFNVAVIGGSVSKGFGILTHHPNVDPLNMHRIIFDHLNAKFPGKGEVAIAESRKDEGRNGITNGALGATGTDYFQYCFSEHMTEDVDLVLVEQAINDQRKIEFSASYEQLVRALLDLPGEPAIINIHTFGFIFPEIGTGGDMHLGVAEHYDIPTINLRSLFLPQILDDFEFAKKVFIKSNLDDPMNNIEGYDMRHIGLWSHQIAANLTNTYLDMQMCEMDRIEAAAGHSRIDELYPKPHLPRLKLLEKFDQYKVQPPFRPNCFSMNAKKNKLVPSHNEGWREWSHEKIPDKKYLVSDQPGSSVSVKFRTSVGTVELFFLMSGTFGLGSVECWADEDKDRKVRLDGYYNLPAGVNIGVARVVRNDLSPGEHELHCVLSDETRDPGGGKEFRIISVMSV